MGSGYTVNDTRDLVADIPRRNRLVFPNRTNMANAASSVPTSWQMPPYRASRYSLSRAVDLSRSGERHSAGLRVVSLALRNQLRDVAMLVHHLPDLQQVLLELVAEQFLRDFQLFVLGICVVAQQEEVSVDAVENLLETLDDGIDVPDQELVEAALDGVVKLHPESIDPSDLTLNERDTFGWCAIALDLLGLLIDRCHDHIEECVVGLAGRSLLQCSAKESVGVMIC